MAVLAIIVLVVFAKEIMTGIVIGSIALFEFICGIFGALFSIFDK